MIGKSTLRSFLVMGFYLCLFFFSNFKIKVVELLLERLAFYNRTAVPPCELDRDPDGANPDNNGGAWMPWL